jgi:hypothetical protein
VSGRIGILTDQGSVMQVAVSALPLVDGGAFGGALIAFVAVEGRPLSEVGA